MIIGTNFNKQYITILSFKNRIIGRYMFMAFFDYNNFIVIFSLHHLYQIKFKKNNNNINLKDDCN